MYISFRQPLFYLSCALTFWLYLSGAAVAQEGKVVEFVSLPDLVRDVARAIAEARLVDNEQPFFIIKEVKLTLKGSWSKGTEGSFSIPVWNFGVDVGGDITSIKSEELVMTLVPPDSGLVGGDALVDLVPLIKTLKDSFSAAREEGVKAKSIAFTRKWLLQRSANANVDAIVMKLGAGISDEKAQSITFQLCQTEDLKTCVGADR